MKVSNLNVMSENKISTKGNLIDFIFFCEDPILIWTGLKLKPRKEKFPSVSLVINEIKKHI
jgi:hypothetical protein